MADCVAAVAVPHIVTTYVFPNALVFTIEGGKNVLYVTHGREDALSLLAEKRAGTSDERYRHAVSVVEESFLLGSSKEPRVTIDSPAVRLIIEAVFKIVPVLDRLIDSVYSDKLGLDAFVLTSSPEAKSGFGVVRTHSGPVFEMIHSRRQASSFLGRHRDAIGDADAAKARLSFGRSPLVGQTERKPETFGGFAAALIGANYRLSGKGFL